MALKARGLPELQMLPRVSWWGQGNMYTQSTIASPKPLSYDPTLPFPKGPCLKSAVEAAQGTG